ncbi:heat-inducible transcriptional repressor HrcA [Paralimibaculum aggregatum]|uniref:Heat-inducible transcription repressor HrcA n=1 Tax=Paralimibaculum aggregatum TaxID=3036245 RepID=A0ABQ6LM32_9RHOB|nr:heat-inducible transcriptional repressor HrcA [Limibaculum sp. NKW23]GMG82747.1 heat-inducible transcriptional repressor HrcA [Limibaculum sp. NKW23]
MAEQTPSLADLNDRSRTIFARLVETYLESGAPVGSRTLSKTLDLGLSAASVRNVMQDLEMLGLLGSPHTSAGRVPTQLGLRLFVDGVLEFGDVSPEERSQIEASIAQKDADMTTMLDQAGSLLSGLSHCASLVMAPTRESAVRHLEFIQLGDGQGLAVLVFDDGTVENRIFDVPPGITPSAMREAANFLNAHLRGSTLGEALRRMGEQIALRRAELDGLAASLVERGIALWDDGSRGTPERLVVRGRANLLEEGQDAEDLERIRQLFDDLEHKRDLAQLIEMVQEGEGVRVFIGSENKLFSLSGSAVVISPYTDSNRRVIGAIGVIGPTRLNYGRIVPIVDYTARLVGRMVADGVGPTKTRKG